MLNDCCSVVYVSVPGCCAQKRVAILQRVADSLLASEEDIMAANEEDVAASSTKIDNTLMQRLKLKPAKLQVCHPYHLPATYCDSYCASVCAWFPKLLSVLKPRL